MLIWRRYRYYYRVIIHIPGVCLGFLPWNSMKKNLHYAIHVIHILHINLWHSSIERVVEGLEDVKVTKCPITTGRAVSWGLRLSFKFSFHWIPTVVCATNTWPATLHPTTLEQTTIDVQAMFWCVKRKYVLFFSQMLFYFVVCVLYIYIFIHSRHPSQAFFFPSNTADGWVSLAKEAQCLTVAAACSDGGLGYLKGPILPSLETWSNKNHGWKVTTDPVLVVLKGKAPSSKTSHLFI